MFARAVHRWELLAEIRCELLQLISAMGQHCRWPPRWPGLRGVPEAEIQNFGVRACQLVEMRIDLTLHSKFEKVLAELGVMLEALHTRFSGFEGGCNCLIVLFPLLSPISNHTAVAPRPCTALSRLILSATSSCPFCLVISAAETPACHHTSALAPHPSSNSPISMSPLSAATWSAVPFCHGDSCRRSL